jgi:hypothetical protein
VFAVGQHRVVTCPKQRSLGGVVRTGPSVAGIIVAIWLIIGAIAAGQRGYFGGNTDSCAKVGTVLVTIVAGPLNYLGVNPKVQCEVPQPSP